MKNQHVKKLSSNILTMGISIHITIITIIIIISSSPNMQVNIFQFKHLERIMDSETFTNTFLYMLGEQIPQFEDYLGNEMEMPSFYNLGFELATGINPNNISTLLTQELPGFNATYTQIYIAGKGSDYSNLPQESPPPNFDKLLKEQDSNDGEPSVPVKPEEDSGDTDENSDVHKDSSVFIYHSHSWEGYLPLIEEEVKPSDSSSVDNKENVVLVGEMLSEQLKKHGIKSSHKQINMAQALRAEGWDYTNSYTLSREFVKAATAQSKDIKYYIDIHRDSARKDSTTTSIGGKDYARLYFVVGKGHENYQENLSFATKIHERLEDKYPGLSKGVYLKTKLEGNGVYNQDISSKSLLVEVGGIDNNQKELNNTVKAFADVFKEIYNGTLRVNAQ